MLPITTWHRGTARSHVFNLFCALLGLDFRHMGLDGFKINNPAEDNKMGFLGSIANFTQNMVNISVALVAVSVGLIISSSAKLNHGDPLVQYIAIGCIALAVSSAIIMSCFASDMKESGSIKGVPLRIVKWLLPFTLALLEAGFGTILCICTNMSLLGLILFGTIFFVIIMVCWVMFFYIQLPKIQQETNRGHARENGVLPDTPGSETVLVTVLNRVLNHLTYIMGFLLLQWSLKMRFFMRPRRLTQNPPRANV